ncbi:MAG: 4'-phosphopantetheinyl transferase superfamily protein [Syntrophales bacterium]
MSILPGVGNDVVDLKDPGNQGKSGDERFLARVFTARERERIAGAQSPDALLWSLWAAKEAAYKAVSGGDSSVCSIPRRYPVLLDSGEASGTTAAAQGSESRLTGRVITPRGEVALRITVTDDYVHAVAVGPDADFAGIIQRVDRMDDGGNPGDASAFVRSRLLCEISRRVDCPVADLAVLKEQSGSGAPRVFLRGRPLTVNISLSHDGRFSAFALAFS